MAIPPYIRGSRNVRPADAIARRGHEVLDEQLADALTLDGLRRVDSAAPTTIRARVPPIPVDPATATAVDA